VPKKPRGFWMDVENRQQFLTEFAAERGFDPLHAESWETVSKGELTKKVSTCPSAVVVNNVI